MNKGKYVVLEHLTLPDRGFRFWSMNSENNTHSISGELWYTEVLFTDDETIAILACEDIDYSKTPTMAELESHYKSQRGL